VDLTSEPIGTDKNGKPVFLSDIWPSQKEVADLEATVSGEMFAKTYANVFDGNPMWNASFGGSKNTKLMASSWIYPLFPG
jgi:aconitate hydratase